MSQTAPCCPLCGEPAQPLFALHDSPLLQNVFYDSREAALAARRGDFAFFHCGRCHHAFNPDFRAEEVAYDTTYDNDQTASVRYREHVAWAVEHLIARCDLGPDSRVLEVGCGSGYFLSQLAARCGAQVRGYDPAYQGRYGDPATIRCEYFQPTAGETYDLVLLRHCVDGFTDPGAVLKAVVPALHPSGRLYVESADLDYILRGADFSLFFHEYARYFSRTSLAVFLGRHGLTLDSAETAFGGQYYACLFRPAPRPEALAETPKRLEAGLAGARKVLVWGVSGRAVTILSHLSLGSDRVAYAADIAPAKQGRFLPVTGQRILSPPEAVEFAPDLVIIPNCNYEDEIRPLFPPTTRFLTLPEATP